MQSSIGKVPMKQEHQSPKFSSHRTIQNQAKTSHLQFYVFLFLLLHLMQLLSLYLL